MVRLAFILAVSVAAWGLLAIADAPVLREAEAARCLVGDGCIVPGPVCVRDGPPCCPPPPSACAPP